jgi:hypothetical protein
LQPKIWINWSLFRKFVNRKILELGVITAFIDKVIEHVNRSLSVIQGITELDLGGLKHFFLDLGQGEVSYGHVVVVDAKCPADQVAYACVVLRPIPYCERGFDYE